MNSPTHSADEANITSATVTYWDKSVANPYWDSSDLVIGASGNKDSLSTVGVPVGQYKFMVDCTDGQANPGPEETSSVILNVKKSSIIEI
jgi:hypothetical protein